MRPRVICADAGSAFAWDQHQDSDANNLVPIEIALRCVHAVRHNERFAAYVLIPLHPERPGPQRSMIIAWTWLTMKMMYRHVLLLPSCGAQRRHSSLHHVPPQLGSAQGCSRLLHTWIDRPTMLPGAGCPGDVLRQGACRQADPSRLPAGSSVRPSRRQGTQGTRTTF